MSDVVLRLFGPPAVVQGERSEPLPFLVPASLLAYLAVARDWVPRQELAYLYRPDADEASALRYLRLQLHRAQQVPWVRALDVEPHQVRWRVPTDHGDFDAALRRGDWAAAIAAYGGTLLAGFALRDKPTFETWLELERGACEQRYRSALERRAEHLEAVGDLGAVADVLGLRAQLDDLDEEATAAHLRALVRAGRRAEAERCFARFAQTLAADLGAKPAAATRAALETVPAAPASPSGPSGATPVSVPSRPAAIALPEPATRFVGRAVELRELDDLLDRDDCRLVTILGLGGAGKSRLALELARRRAGVYPDGVHFVPLVDLVDEPRMLERVAELTGLELDAAGDAVAQLRDHLADRRALLVLDNFEHLEGATALLEALTAGDAVVQVVATSRRRLALRGEWVFDLHGLDVGGVGEAVADAAATPSDAVELFVSAARRVAPRLAFGADDLMHAARIARRVEGLPLALELAATWVRVMPVAHIAREIAAGYALLETDLVDLPERHRSLRAVLDRTWADLSSAKRAALARLSVFAGGSTLAAAEAVTGAQRSLLLSLLNQSLVQRVAADRFASHPLVVQYAAEALAADPDADALAREAHAAHYEHRLLQIGARPEAGSSDALRALEPDAANLEHAWTWLVGTGAFARAVAVARTLFDHFIVLGQHRRAGELCRATLALVPDAGSPAAIELRCTVELFATVAARERGDLGAARAWAEAAGARAADHGLPLLVARAAHYLGDVQQTTGEFDEAEAAYARAVAGFEALDRPDDLANVVNSLGALEAMRERYPQAEAHFRRCVVLFGDVGDELSRATALTNLGYLADVRGDYDEAARRYEQGLTVYERHGYARGVSAIKNNLVVLYGSLGRLDEAEAAGRESLAIKEAVGDAVGRIITLKNLGDLQLMRGAPARAPEFYVPALRAAVDADATPRLLQVLAAYVGYLEATGQHALADDVVDALLRHPVTPPSVRAAALRHRPAAPPAP